MQEGPVSLGRRAIAGEIHEPILDADHALAVLVAHGERVAGIGITVLVIAFLDQAGLDIGIGEIHQPAPDHPRIAVIFSREAGFADIGELGSVITVFGAQNLPRLAIERRFQGPDAVALIDLDAWVTPIERLGPYQPRRV